MTRWIGGLLLALLLVSASDAFAQRRPRQVLREALSEFDRGNYAEARALFLEAYELDPSARLLRGAGMAAFEEREYVTSHRLLRRALEDEASPLPARDREATEELLARAETFLGRFRFQVDPEGAEVQIDLRPVEAEPDGSVLLAIGGHALQVRAPGYETLERRLRVEGGENETLELSLASDFASFEAPPERDKELDGLSTALMIGGGGLVALGGGALGWWIERRGERGRCEDAIAEGDACLNLATLRSQSRGVGTAAFVLLLGGITTLTAGMLRWSWSDDRAVPLACGVLPGGGACSLSRSF